MFSLFSVSFWIGLDFNWEWKDYGVSYEMNLFRQPRIVLFQEPPLP